MYPKPPYDMHVSIACTKWLRIHNFLFSVRPVLGFSRNSIFLQWNLKLRQQIPGYLWIQLQTPWSLEQENTGFCKRSHTTNLSLFLSLLLKPLKTYLTLLLPLSKTAHCYHLLFKKTVVTGMKKHCSLTKY